MRDLARILVVAATARELAPSTGWPGILCGVGPVEAAVNSARAIAEHRPEVVLHVGIAGARRSRGLAAGTLVVGTASRYCDLGDLPPEWAPKQLETPSWLVQAALSACPLAAALPVGTSARVGGTHDGEVQVEAMEGFAVLRAAQMAGVPAIEVRAISNDIEEQDRSRWQFAQAFEAITTATPALVRALAAAPGAFRSHA